MSNQIAIFQNDNMSDILDTIQTFQTLFKLQLMSKINSSLNIIFGQNTNFHDVQMIFALDKQIKIKVIEIKSILQIFTTFLLLLQDIVHN